MGDKEQVDAKQEQAPAKAEPAIPPSANPPPPQQPATATTNPENPEKMSKSDRIMAAATVVIAIGTLVSAGAICFQWREMVNGGADTTAIKVAAQKQADAAQQFADTADEINGNINDAVGKLNDQANATKRVANEALVQAQIAVSGSRAWMVPSGNGEVKDGSIRVDFKNMGHSQARFFRFGEVWSSRSRASKICHMLQTLANSGKNWNSAQANGIAGRNYPRRNAPPARNPG